MKMLEIRVRDQGIGLKNSDDIGKMFNKLDVKDNVNQNGIGFGLTITKMIVEQLGGTIKFRNHTNFDKEKNSIKTFQNQPFTHLNPPDKNTANQIEEDVDNHIFKNEEDNDKNIIKISDSFIEKSSDRESQGLSVILQFPFVTSGDEHN